MSEHGERRSGVEPLEPFDVVGPLPTGTTVLEASAGTGKTYAVGALVARYVAEGEASLDEMLVITFGRAASQELRDRVRAQLVAAERVLADREGADRTHELVAWLLDAEPHELDLRRRRLLDALAGFDAATIATTHQFCQLVLRSLGVAGDTDGRAELVEDLTELVEEIVDDLYLARYGNLTTDPPFDRVLAGQLARAVVSDPHAKPTPDDDDATASARERVSFACEVLRELDRRKRRGGLLSYDDLLSRLADALEGDDSPARQRMRQRWKVVLVDEFQDTDPVQWQVLDRAFSGVATVVLIGDPKQAVYAFRGGDVTSYLYAAGTAGTRRTLATNWRSDAPLVEALQVLLRDVALGDERIVVHEVHAHHGGSRIAGVPSTEPVRLRHLGPEAATPGGSGTVGIAALRSLIADDLADDVAALLASGATYAAADGVRAVGAGDVAVLMTSLRHVAVFREALAARGIPSVITSGSGVMRSEAADAWLTLLEALEQPNRVGRVRALGLTPFIGLAPSELVAGGEDLSDQLSDRVRGWVDLFRIRGIAAVYESMVAAGLPARALARPDGERLLTDLQHLAQVLHDVARRERFALPALVAWLRRERESALADNERTRRLDTDAAAVQISTIHGSKGLQYPFVYLPLAFNRWRPDTPLTLRYHDESGRRCLDVGGRPSAHVRARAEAEECGEELRLTYVALTRAECQVVAWWAPSRDARGSGLTRLLLGRAPGVDVVPDAVEVPLDPAEVESRLAAWQVAGALHLESVGRPAPTAPLLPPPPPRLALRTFDRTIDQGWRRTSYSGLIRVDEQLVVDHESEPEETGTTDEAPPDDDLPVLVAEEPPPESPRSPMSDLPAGAAFGSLVHGVLETADPDAPDLAAELRRCVEEQQHGWVVDVDTVALVEGLLPMQVTTLGPLADDLRLVDIGRRDRLCELDFEFPLRGGDLLRAGAPRLRLARVADVLERHLPADDLLASYAEQLRAPALGEQELHGYLSGSIDVVLRVPSAQGPRYLVVDYKTNRLGEHDRELTAWDYRRPAMAEAMLHSHYPLQALLYSVVLHRYLRWRQPGYDPAVHLGGVLYLFVRGMCGPETPSYDGDPAGVFSWRPSAELVTELSDLLDQGEAGA